MLAKMLNTPEGQVVIETIVTEYKRSRNILEAVNKAAEIAEARGTLTAFQVGLTIDALTFLRLVLPLIDKFMRDSSEKSKAA
jgi:hypothetical protein